MKIVPVNSLSEIKEVFSDTTRKDFFDFHISERDKEGGYIDLSTSFNFSPILYPPFIFIELKGGIK